MIRNDWDKPFVQTKTAILQVQITDELCILEEVKRMNLFQALTDAMDITLASDESASKLKHSSVIFTLWLSFLFEYKLYISILISYI